jgi:hypothetical protein
LEDGCVPYSEGLRKTWCGGGTKDLSEVDCVERNIAKVSITNNPKIVPAGKENT